LRTGDKLRHRQVHIAEKTRPIHDESSSIPLKTSAFGDALTWVFAPLGERPGIANIIVRFTGGASRVASPWVLRLPDLLRAGRRARQERYMQGNLNSSRGVRRGGWAAVPAVLAGALMVGCAAGPGYHVTEEAEARVKPGMTAEEVLRAIGPPYRDMKYRNQPGRTFTYRVVGFPPPMLFDVDFDEQGRVRSTGERMDLDRGMLGSGGL